MPMLRVYVNNRTYANIHLSHNLEYPCNPIATISIDNNSVLIKVSMIEGLNDDKFDISHLNCYSWGKSWSELEKAWH